MSALGKVIHRRSYATRAVNKDTNLRYTLSHVIIPRCYLNRCQDEKWDFKWNCREKTT